MKVSISFFILLCLIFNVATATASASRKTDIITLYNGDRITGEIKHLYAGQLELSTNAIGTLQIEWQEIAKIESLYHYEIRLAEGGRFYGSIAALDRPGQLRISDDAGAHTLSYLEVVEIRPVFSSFKDQVDVYLSLGFSYNNASSVGQSNFLTDASYENESSRNTLNGRLSISDTNETSTSSSKVDLSRSVWTNREDIYRIATGSWETNDELGLDYRFAIGAGLGKHFLDTQKSAWQGSVGLQVLTEKPENETEQQNVEGVLATSYSTWDFKTPELHFKINTALYPGITDSGRWRADGDTKLRWEIVNDLYLDFSAFGTFDNKAAKGSQFDYGFSTGIGWDY